MADHIQTIIGERKKQYIDCDTGEFVWVDQISKHACGTKNFWKCYLMDFLTVLGIIDSKQLDVFIYIAENTNPNNNIFIGTYSKIGNDVDVCKQTIGIIMKKLQENNFIKKVQNGVWLVNPNILMKGSDTKRQILLSYYKRDEPIDRMTFSRTKRTPLPSSEESPVASDGQTPLKLEEHDNDRGGGNNNLP